MHKRTRSKRKNRSRRRMRGGDGSTVDIVFSHNQRMRCVLDSIRGPDEKKAPQPKNGGIVIIFQMANGKFKRFYDSTQFKKDGTKDTKDNTTFFKKLEEWFKENGTTALSARKTYVYVRHGKGWHNVHKNLERIFSPRGKDSHLEPEGITDAETAGTLLGQILKRLGLPIQALCCSDLQRTAETAQIAICVARRSLGDGGLLGATNAPSPNRIIVLPCNHELPKGQCGAWAGLSAASLSSENETSLPARQPVGFSGEGAEGTTVWGKMGSSPQCMWLPYDYSAYYKFYAGGPRGASGARNVNLSRFKCRDKPFPENITWTLNNLTVPVLAGSSRVPEPLPTAPAPSTVAPLRRVVPVLPQDMDRRLRLQKAAGKVVGLTVHAVNANNFIANIKRFVEAEGCNSEATAKLLGDIQKANVPEKDRMADPEQGLLHWIAAQKPGHPENPIVINGGPLTQFTDQMSPYLKGESPPLDDLARAYAALEPPEGSGQPTPEQFCEQLNKDSASGVTRELSGGRRRKSRRKTKRRRVKVTLCKKKSFHKCKSRKHRKKRS